MPRGRTVLVVVVIAVVCVAVGAIVWIITHNVSTVASNTLVPPLVVTRPLAEYGSGSQDAVAALDAALAAGDDAALPAAALRAKNALMGLTVPADARAAHLALILALSRFEQDSTPEARAALAAAVAAFPR